MDSELRVEMSGGLLSTTTKCIISTAVGRDGCAQNHLHMVIFSYSGENRSLPARGENNEMIVFFFFFLFHSHGVTAVNAKTESIRGEKM